MLSLWHYVQTQNPFQSTPRHWTVCCCYLTHCYSSDVLFKSVHGFNVLFCFFFSFSFFAFLRSRSVSSSQRGLQSPVHRGTGERGCVFLSPWASPGLQQQDVWGGGLLQPPPKVQPGVWAVQDHGEVLLLSGMGARPRWRQLSQHR